MTNLPILGATERPSRGLVLENPPVVSFVSLGCAKNLVDSEKMLGQLVESGAVLSGDESLADTVVVNTCGFLESSRREAVEIISELAQRKRAGTLKRIVVAGCLVQRDGESLQKTIPEIDALIGVNNRDDVVRAVWRMDRDAGVDLHLGDYHGQPWEDQGRVRLTPRHFAYLRISEGCNQKCTFCTIPSIRGPMHSKTIGQIIAEGRELVSDGAREIILIGQDTTSYGVDFAAAAAGGSAVNVKPGTRPAEAGDNLATLLRSLDRELTDADWIRLMYVYPSIMTDEIIDAIASAARIVKYIDIPLQHISDNMLRRMARRVTRKHTDALLEKLRDRIPDLSIRTTFIVGFPGETDADFEELVEFVENAGFDAVGAFKYSLEPETPAGKMPDQVDEAVKQERYDRLMAAQQAVAFAAARRFVGKRFEVLVDSAAESGFIARHAGQAPDVDGICALPPTDELEVGDMVEVECVDTDGYDLICDFTGE
ncbi:MAG: 30S ribosomal protein S12 methylthiotransferase RimO [Phycisphaerae bacterium]